MSGNDWYARPVLLDRVRHRRTRVRPAAGWSHAARANSVLLAGVEFGEACKEYPVVFTRQADGALAAVAVLGLREGENLYVDAQGRWTAGYIPAVVRRYPFVLAQLPGEQLGVCIDEGYPGLGEGEGEALFDAQGRDTPYLREAVEVLQRHQHEHLRTLAVCRRLDEAGLLVAMDARADLVDGRSYTLRGMLVVDEGRLAALPDATVLSLFRSGELHLVAMHLLSLSNLQRLVDRIAARPPATPTPAGSPPGR